MTKMEPIKNNSSYDNNKKLCGASCHAINHILRHEVQPLAFSGVLKGWSSDSVLHLHKVGELA